MPKKINSKEENKYQVLLNSSPDFVFESRIDNFQFTIVDPEVHIKKKKPLSGNPASQFTFKNFPEKVFPAALTLNK